jgi:hypothetical protein
MTVYVVMEGPYCGAVLRGIYKNREDAQAAVDRSPDFIWIVEEEVQ